MTDSTEDNKKNELTLGTIAFEFKARPDGVDIHVKMGHIDHTSTGIVMDHIAEIMSDAVKSLDVAGLLLSAEADAAKLKRDLFVSANRSGH